MFLAIYATIGVLFFAIGMWKVRGKSGDDELNRLLDESDLPRNLPRKKAWFIGMGSLFWPLVFAYAMTLMGRRK